MTNTDDGIREMHGVSCQTHENKRSSFAVAEGEDRIVVLSITVVDPSRYLTLAQARYIADRIYGLCHRIESRKAAVSETPRPKAFPAAKQEKQS